MNVSDLIDPSFSYRLIATLMHFLWQGCLVALLAVLGDGLLSRASASRRYALHVAALAIMVACVAITFSRIEAPVLAPAVSVEPMAMTTVAEPIAPSRVDDDSASMPSTAMPAFVGVEPPLPASLPVIAVEAVESPIVIQERPAGDSDRWRRLQGWAPQIALLYFVCCGLLLARLIRGTWVAHRLRRMSTTVSDDSLIAMLQRQAQELGLRVLPRIAWCAEVSIPLVIGVLKPMILLPAAAATGLSADQLQALITHELAHIRRYDLLVNLAQRVVESMLFFHPAVWFISRRISNEREQACDELVLATGCERLRYADALVRMAELSSSLRRLGTSAPATSLAASGANSSEFKRRVLKVLSVPTNSQLRPSRIALLVIVALIIGVTVSASRLRVNVFAETQPQNVEHSPGAGRGSPDPALDPTAGLPDSDKESNATDNANGDLRRAQEIESIGQPKPMWCQPIKAPANAWPSEVGPLVIDERRVIIGEHVLDLRTGESLGRLTFGDFSLDFLRLSANRRYLLACGTHPKSFEGNFTFPSTLAEVWDLTTLKRVGSAFQVPHSIYDGHADVSQDGKVVVSGSREDVVLFDVATGKEINKLDVKPRRIDAVGFSPDGQWLVVSNQNDLTYWKWRTAEKPQTLHVGRTIISLAFSPDSRYLAEGPDCQVDIEIRDLQTLKVAHALRDEFGSPLYVKTMCFSSDGKRFIASNDVGVDETKLLIPHRLLAWELPTGRLKAKGSRPSQYGWGMGATPGGFYAVRANESNGLMAATWVLADNTAGAEATTAITPKADVEWGPAVNGLKARAMPVLSSMSEDAIDPAQRVSMFEKPEDVAFVVELENVSDKPIKLLNTRHSDDAKGKANSDWFGQFLFSIDLFDESGKLIEHPDVKVVDLDLALVGHQVATVEPGKSHRFLLRPASWSSPFKLPLDAGRFRAAVRYHGLSDRVTKRMKDYRPNSPQLTAISGDITAPATTFAVRTFNGQSRRSVVQRESDLPRDENDGGQAVPFDELVWGQPVNGLRAALSFLPLQETHAHGEKPAVLLHLQNVGTQPLTLLSKLSLPNAIATIKNDKGELVELDAAELLGERLNGLVSLKPQQIVVLDAGYLGLAVTQERANAFDARTPRRLIAPAGKYSVQLEATFNNILHWERGQDKVLAKDAWVGTLQTGAAPLTIVTAPVVGLEFLKPYPKLHGLSLDMTEPQFLEIVKQQELKTRKTVEGEKVTHHIPLGDGHTLIVMFDKDAKCSGIQRVREDVKSDDTRSQALPGNEKNSLYPRVIRGKITDAEGKPVARALIEWGPDYPHDAPRESVRSADDGTYRLEVQKAGGHFKLGVSAAGNAPLTFKGLVPGPRSEPTELDVKLPTETTLRIAIIDEAKQPIPNLEVLPMTPQRGFTWRFSMDEQPEPIPGHTRPTTCDAQGVCQLRQLLVAPEPLLKAEAADTPAQAEFKQRTNRGGWLSLRITRGGEWVHEHAISRHEFFESKGVVQIVVPDYRNPLKESLKNGTIFGQVVATDGKPVSNYQVTLRHRPEAKAVSDAEGRFEWGGKLDPDNGYELRIFAKGFAPQTVRIAPKETQRSQPRRIELQPHASAEFVLLDAETQKPIPKVIVVAALATQSGRNYIEWNDLGNYADGHHGLENVLRVTTGADGRFTVPEGDTAATLLILTPGYARTIVTPQQRPARNEQGLMPIALPRGASIHGVAAKNSRLIQRASGVSLQAEPVNDFDQMFHGLERDANGECVIESLAAGDYYVSLDHSDGNMSTACWNKKITLKPGEKKIVPLGEMTGTLTLSGRTSPFTDLTLTRKPLADAANNLVPDGVLSVATISDVDGNFELDQLEAGNYSIELARLQHFGGRSFGAASKGPKEIELTKNTHIDFTTGAVRALGRSELAPNKNAAAAVAAAPTRSQAEPANEKVGLEFLKPYPKLHGLSLDMTEPQFLEIVKQQELKTRKTVEGEKVTHRIALGDGHTLIVMFGKDAKCSGIQRVRGEDKSAGHFNGRVTGPDGKPLSRARVFVAPWTENLKTIGAVRAETDAEGRFEFDAPDMTYTNAEGRLLRRQGMLIVTAGGFAADGIRTWGNNLPGFRSHSDPIEGAALNLRLAKSDVPIEGRFLNHDGTPLIGARVEIIGVMIPQKYDLDAHLAREVKFTVVNVTDYERELYQPRLLPGLVVETKTDAEGRFQLSGIGRDRLAWLKVSAPSVVDTELMVMTRDTPDIRTRLGGEPTVESQSMIYGARFTLRLKPGRTVKGRVIDRETRQPIAGMRVGPRQNALNDVTPSLYPWVTDGAGRFTISGLSPSVAQEEIAAVATPGLPYPSASVMTDGKADIVIETSRGIPFRLKLVDEQNRPVDAEVSYTDIQPNPHLAKQRDEFHWPVNRATKKADGTYEGFVLPGPGAVLVQMPQGSKYRPARVDPKSFFAPGRTNWTAEEQTSEYGNTDELVISLGVYRGTTYRHDRIQQKDYAAIVLVNPPKDSGTLELSAIIVMNPRAGRGSPDPALDPTAGLPNSVEETNPPNNANGDLRSKPAAGSGDKRRAQPTASQEGIIESVADKTIEFNDGLLISTDAETKYTRLTDKGEESVERKELKSGIRVRYERAPGKGATKVVILPTQPDDAPQKDEPVKAAKEIPPAKQPPLEFRIVATAADRNADGVAWLPIIEPRMPLPAGKSGIDLPVEEKVDNKWRGLLWNKAEHALLADGTWRVVKCEVVPVADVETVRPRFSIRFTLDAAGGAALRRLTKAHLNQPLAIVVEGTIIVAPLIRSEIGESGEITGNFTREQAEKLVAVLLLRPQAANPKNE